MERCQDDLPGVLRMTGNVPRAVCLGLLLAAGGLAVAQTEDAPPVAVAPSPPLTPVPQPPAQPADGPGGAAYSHATVERDHFGGGALECWVFKPAGPVPALAPVVVFCHGWLAMQPWTYMGWITHLARRGNIVIYPRYQAGARTPPSALTPNAASAVRDALTRLAEQRTVRPDTTRVSVVGHSMGGVVAADLAARWKGLGIPRPRVLLCVEPRGTDADNSRWGLGLPNMAALDADTLLVCVSGSDDHAVSPAAAEAVYNAASQVPAENRSLLMVSTDRHGAPALVADHLFPTSPDSRRTDALDYLVCWKLLDGLMDAAFSGTHREYALGGTPQQRSVGVWSDGVAVTELSVR
jgi:pimeloyl-ACP methyl ester carboxylesterase